MGILTDSGTKVVVQGITGRAGSLHTRTMIEYGTRVVAGVRPGAGGQMVEGVPVFDTVKDAVRVTGANASVLFVPPAMAKDAALEAAEAGIRLIVMPPEHIPLHDELILMSRAARSSVRIIGPNTAGMIEPSERCKIGFVPNRYFVPGSVAIASRSGTLMYEYASAITRDGYGESVCVGVGGDGIVGTRFAEFLKLVENDPRTRVTLLICEIGGTQEEEAAELVRSGAVRKPVVAYLAGITAPKEKRMGHAGAIIAGDTGTVESKIKAFREAGISVGSTPGEIMGLIKKNL